MLPAEASLAGADVPLAFPTPGAHAEVVACEATAAGAVRHPRGGRVPEAQDRCDVCMRRTLPVSQTATTLAQIRAKAVLLHMTLPRLASEPLTSVLVSSRFVSDPIPASAERSPLTAVLDRISVSICDMCDSACRSPPTLQHSRRCETAAQRGSVASRLRSTKRGATNNTQRVQLLRLRHNAVDTMS